MLCMAQQDFSKYVELIEATVDLEQLQHHEYVVKPSFDTRLQEVCVFVYNCLTDSCIQVFVNTLERHFEKMQARQQHARSHTGT